MKEEKEGEEISKVLKSIQKETSKFKVCLIFIFFLGHFKGFELELILSRNKMVELELNLAKFVAKFKPHHSSPSPTNFWRWRKKHKLYFESKSIPRLHLGFEIKLGFEHFGPF